MVLRTVPRPQSVAAVGSQRSQHCLPVAFAGRTGTVPCAGWHGSGAARCPVRRGHETGAELSATARVSVAHGSGNGVCDPSWGGDGSVLRGDGGVVAEVCVVQQERPRENMAGGEPEAERSWVIRRAGERVDVVSREAEIL